MLGEGPTYGINENFVSPEKWFSINFSKVNTIFCLSLQNNGDNSFMFVNGKEVFKLKADHKNTKLFNSILSRKNLMDLVLLSLQKHL